MTFVPRLAALALAFSSSLSGCLVLGGGAGSPSGGTFAGDGCDDVLYPAGAFSEEKFPVHEDESPKAQILLATCHSQHVRTAARTENQQWPRVKPMDAKKAYAALDDRKLDVVQAALIVVMATKDEMPLGEPLGNKAPASVTKARRELSGDALHGMALTMGEIVEASQGLEGALGAVDLSADAKTAFRARFEGVLGELRKELSSVGQKRLYVEVALAVYKQRVEHYQTYKDEFDQLDALHKSADVPDAKLDDVVAKIDALRVSFIAKCKHLECTQSPFYAQASRELARLAVLKKDLSAAEAECALFINPGSYVAGFPQAISAAQQIEWHRAAAASSAQDKAVNSGLDPDTARRLTGVSASDTYEFSPINNLMSVEMVLPDVSRAINKDNDTYGASKTWGGKVIAVEKVTPTTRRVRFERITGHYEESFNCVHTNHLVAINDDGTLRYEEVCQHRPMTETHDVAPPSLVPAAEAAGITAGDKAELVGTAKDARVVRVKRSDKIVQVRDNVFGG